MCCLFFEEGNGFCRRRMGKIIAAFRAMDSKQELFAYSRKSLDSSCTNVLPALPDGTLNKSFFQWITSS